MTSPHRRQPSKQGVRVAVTGRNMPVTDALRKYVVAKMEKLDRYLDRLSQIEVTLSMGHTREASRRNVAEATAMVKGTVLRGEVADADMYAAVDGLFHKMHHQLTRFKERTRDHKGHGPPDDDVSPSATLESDDEMEHVAEADGGIVRVKQFSMKPMFSDEAIGELEGLGHAFYVFLNGETERVSVVYRRQDGAYGLIEPAFD